MLVVLFLWVLVICLINSVVNFGLLDLLLLFICCRFGVCLLVGCCRFVLLLFSVTCYCVWLRFCGVCLRVWCVGGRCYFRLFVLVCLILVVTIYLFMLVVGFLDCMVFEVGLLGLLI